MPFTSISTVQTQPDRPVTTDLINALVDRTAFNNAQSGSLSILDILNGSFEIDSDNDATPDGWDITAFTGGSASISTAQAAHGAQSIQMSHPGGAGNGGARIDSDFFPVSTAHQYTLRWQGMNSATGVRNKVVARFFDRNQTTLAETTLSSALSSAGSTGAWSATYATVTPPSSATYMKVRIDGGTTDADPGAAANIYFDEISVESRGRVKNFQLKTSTAILSGNDTSLIQVTLADFSFFPNVAGATGVNRQINAATTVVDDNIGRFNLNPVTALGNYSVRYRFITASEGYKAALFSSNTTHVYTFKDAPPNYREIFDGFATGNGFSTYQLFTSAVSTGA